MRAANERVTATAFRLPVGRGVKLFGQLALREVVMTKIKMPNNWEPRSYQMRAWEWLEAGGKRAVLVWHRRSGKDEVALHNTACQMLQRQGVYWHMLPEAAQGRRVLWDAVNPHTGKRRIDEAFPPEIVSRRKDNEMWQELVNGSTWQVVGSDNYDSLMGSPPVGIVFSEFALSKPSAWGYMRPILRENDGWAMFVSTPRGRNQLHHLLQHSEEDPKHWFGQILTVEDTDVFTEDQLKAEREELHREYGPEIGEALFRQEYYCSFDASVPGAVWAAQMERMQHDGRITTVPYDPSVGVETWWDLGIRDATAVIFVQRVGAEIHVIDAYQSHGKSLDEDAREIKNKPYVYTRHIWPHDGEARSKATGKTLQETAQSYGLDPEIAPKLDKPDQINAGRQLLDRTWIDHRLGDFLEAMRQYHFKYDEGRHVFSQFPEHDWSSHFADAWQTGAVMAQQTTLKQPQKHRARRPVGGWMAS